ncbi:MAG: hypothetical protein AB7O96_17325 [Pseudobdellovibrionaceae bacterium]
MVVFLRKIYIYCALVLLIMTLQRFFLLSGTTFVGNLKAEHKMSALFIMGLRFDLLVIGFALMPVACTIWVYNFFSVFFKNAEPSLRYCLHSLTGLWLLIFGLAVVAANYFDGLQFSVTKERLSPSRLDIAIENAAPLMQYPFYKATFSFFIVVSVALLLFRTFYIHIENKKLHNLWLSFIFTLIVAMASRGTWTPHHLNINHSKITNIELINNLVLNPIWSYWNQK